MTNDRCLAGAVEAIAAEAVAPAISRLAVVTSRIRESRCGRCAAFVALGLLVGCGEQNRYVAPPPPKVVVSLPLQQPLTRYLETTGNAAAFNSVDLVARVQGFLQEIKYQDGASASIRRSA
jgi:multidrug efflux pump subunit AcrA (membrane-fusion protein)